MGIIFIISRNIWNGLIALQDLRSYYMNELQRKLQQAQSFSMCVHFSQENNKMTK